MIRVLRLRDFPQLSYCITSVADDNGLRQLPPDEQVVPPDFLARFQEGERQLVGLTDSQLDDLSMGQQDSPEVLALIERAPEAASIIDDAFDGPFHEFLFEMVGAE